MCWEPNQVFRRAVDLRWPCCPRETRLNHGPIPLHSNAEISVCVSSVIIVAMMYSRNSLT